MTTDITIFEPTNFGIIVKAAPQAYNENQISHERCLAYGKQLLERVQTEGMSDNIDQEIATFIDRSKRTVRKMNNKRSAVTQLFDNIRSAYTALENEVDPTKKGTVPAQLQELRNQYAAKKRAEFEAQQRQYNLELAKTNAKKRYTADVKDDLIRQFNELITDVYNSLIALDKSVTLANYDNVFETISNYSDNLPQDWYDSLHASLRQPSALSLEEANKIAQDVKQSLHQHFHDNYTAQVSDYRSDLLDRLPSKRKELEHIKQANAEEAERIKQQMAQRELIEAEQRAKERAEREAKDKAAAELAAQKQEMDSLFDEAQLQATQVKTSVKKRIHVLNSEGFMQVVGMWWAQYGCSLSVPELEKIFSKQLTFCNKLANDKKGAIFINSEHIEYIDEIKAK